MPTYHKTKADLVETLWEKMIEAGADQGLIACVSGQVLDLVPPDDSKESYDKMVDAIIELAWKRGVHDCLQAIELGAIQEIHPNQGKN